MPKRKHQKKNSICPCCHQPKCKTDVTLTVATMIRLDKLQYPNADEDLRPNYLNLLDADFSWACDECHQSQKAELTNPLAQNFCWNPYYAYFDTEHECKTCSNSFVFDKKEKRYWFETLQFWIDSVPINCPSCRKEIRTLKKENKLLSELLQKEETELSISELEQVIEVYSKWNKEDKKKYYESLLKKKKKQLNH